ncbi:MAG: FAD/NAD(P)-binding protein [bacterium]|nr:FAD/NAD(P)-binding protein [bacterium]
MSTVAIVGGGFSGTMVAAHLLRRGLRGRVLLVERHGPFSGGVAYGTRCRAHSLNVPAGRMSAFADDEDHFLAWMRRREPGTTGASFVPRLAFGHYLRQVLAEAEADAPSWTELERIPGEAVGLEPLAAGGIQVRLADGRRLASDVTILAVGNFPPATPALADPSGLASPRYAPDPWAHDALDVDADDPVLLVGTGLTMIDVVLGLVEQQHRGPIYAVSRRGLLPQPHRQSAVPPPHYPRPRDLDEWPRTASGLVRALRREVLEATCEGHDWREVLASIRADTPAMWASLDERARARLLRHLRPYWETHRHRAAPAPWAGVQATIDTGQLDVRAARLLGMRPVDGAMEVALRGRGGADVERLRVGRVINCTGPDTDLSRVREPLIVALREVGMLRPDAFGLGLDTDGDGALLDAAGRASDRLFLVGPLRKGRLWENTAVPELRVEAAALAERLAMRLATTAPPAGNGRMKPAPRDQAAGMRSAMPFERARAGVRRTFG